MAVEYKEKRRHQRYQCDAGVQIQPENVKSGYWGTLSDISVGGCYINTFSPLPAGKVVSLVIQTGDKTINVAGKTVTCHPGVGMGIAFDAFSEGSADALKSLLEQLASRTGQKDAVSVFH